MNAEPRVLLVEDDPEMRLLLEEVLGEAGFTTTAASNGLEAIDRLSQAAPDVIVTDLEMPGMKGDQLLREIRARNPEIPVVIITAFGSIDSAVSAVKAGAYHYLVKPFAMEQLVVTLQNAHRESELRREIRQLKTALAGEEPQVVAESPAMKAALEVLRRAASVNTPVLLMGESGSGKEVLARLLHAWSDRRSAPFLAVNCAAIPEGLLESQLFGHRKGAFTDARENRRGLFQEASGGTLFLDEIGDMPLPLQAKILRVLQEREVHPLGAPSPIPVDVRIVTATHRDIESLAEQERFRHDLLYRINVISVRVPPLRERPEDLAPLVAHLLAKHAHRLGRPACAFSEEAMEVLRGHRWPGNVRELENVIERALVLGHDDVLWARDLPESLRATVRSVPPTASSESSLAEIERDHILRTLEAVDGNKAAAARRLGMDRKTLYRKLAQYGAEES